MKKLLPLVFAMLAVLQIQAQDIPSIKVGKDKLGITSLDVKVEVVGNIATTTYDMLFYNPTNSVLEGELSFPLAENQRVSRLALDVNGKLREAVVVEKEIGRVAFEAVVRRGVDPVLLEKGTGNNYKARIYPIFAKRYKRVVLAHEQELIESEGDHYFQLPLGFKKNLDNFSVEMNIYDQKLKPELTKGGLENFNFEGLENSYTAKFSRANFTPAESLTIKIPQASDYAKVITSDDYFYSFLSLDAAKRLRDKPESITLFWDVSLSMKDRLFDKEMSVLDRYFKHLQFVKVKIVSFSNAIISEKWYNIKNGKWDVLRAELSNSVYDGGTSYECLLENIISDEILIFSDGMKNLSHLKVDAKAPVFVVNSLIKANHSELINICEVSNGKYLNLNSLSSDEAFDELSTQAFKFLGFESSNTTVEFFPVESVNVASDFSVAGKGFNEGDTFKLKFGFGNEVTEERIVTIKNNAKNDLVKRFWAQKKLDVLQRDSDKNKNDIVSHAKKYSLVSDHTSLIVLERVWDYVKYKIIPPKELLEEYNRIMAQHENKKVVSTAAASDNREEGLVESEDAVVEESNRVASGNIRNQTISGTVTDATGPLPGVNIIIKGTSTGTQTDFNGNYTIQASSGDELAFSFVGLQTLETTISSSRTINISMVEDSTALEEVVVTAQGIKREKRAIGYAVSEVKAEEIESRAEGDVARVLSGKASGVQITNQSGTSGSATNVVIRGYNSITGNNQALFIVDGVPFSTDTNTPQGSFASGNVGSSRLLDLDPNNIESVKVLKGLAAATLYGTAGRNGVIIITTKSGGSLGTSSSSRRYTEPQNPFVKVKKYIVDNSQANTEYLRELKKANSAREAYGIYLKQRDQYKKHTAYYIDVYDFFKKWNGQQYGNRILSNIAEIDFDNYELLRAFAYKLEEANNYKLATFIFEQILKLRPEDAQSYRDLALAYREKGNASQAIELLKNIVNENVYSEQGRRKFEGMQTIAANEIMTLLNNDKEALKKNDLKLKNKTSEFDVRVVIDWNHNDTDIDLHVIDPNYEVCSYKNTKTALGGKISRDMTQGFGPEEFTIRKAKRGNYFIEVNYYGDNYQKIENPTFMKVTLFKNYGKPNETKEIKVVRLVKKRDRKVVAKLSI